MTVDGASVVDMRYRKSDGGTHLLSARAVGLTAWHEAATTRSTSGTVVGSVSVVWSCQLSFNETESK